MEEEDKDRPEGRPGSSDVFPLSGMSGLSFDPIFLVLLLLLLSSHFSAVGPVSCRLSRNFFKLFVL